MIVGRAGTLDPGPQLAIPPLDKGTILNCAIFRLSSLEGTTDFADLGAIVSEVQHSEYVDSGPEGVMFGRHPGRAVPPSITLKRAMRTGTNELWLWTWHEQARLSLPTMRREAALSFYKAGDDLAGEARLTYLLLNAWPSKIEISGTKAGATDFVYQSVTIQCEHLIDESVPV